MEKFRRKKFHSTFRGLCPWSVLIFLSRHPPFAISASHSVSPYLSWIVSRSDFFLEVFTFLFQRRVTRSQRVIFKMLEKIAASFLTSFFFCKSSSSAAALFQPLSIVVVIYALSLIWMGGIVSPDEIRVSSREETRRRRKLSPFPPGHGRTKNVEQSKLKLAMLMKPRGWC